MKNVEDSSPIYVFLRNLFYEELRMCSCFLAGITANKKVNSTAHFALIKKKCFGSAEKRNSNVSRHERKKIVSKEFSNSALHQTFHKLWCREVVAVTVVAFFKIVRINLILLLYFFYPFNSDTDNATSHIVRKLLFQKLSVA